MIIKHTFTGMLHGTVKTIIENDMTSPAEGYTQRHAEASGKGYEEGRAEELLGDSDFWEWQSSTKE